jgi:hypothetical protein
MENFVSAILGDLATRSINFLISKSSKPAAEDTVDHLPRVLLRALFRLILHPSSNVCHHLIYFLTKERQTFEYGRSMFLQVIHDLGNFNSYFLEKKLNNLNRVRDDVPVSVPTSLCSHTKF